MSAPADRPAVATIAARWDDPTDHHCFNGNGVSCVTYNRMVDEAGADIKALVGEVERLRAALAEYADRARWEFVAFPLASGNVRLCATFDGGWGVAEAALGTAPPAPQT